MKRLFSILAIVCIMAFGTANASTNAYTVEAATTTVTTPFQEETTAVAA